MTVDEAIAAPQYSFDQGQKESFLLDELGRLERLHQDRCAEYGRIAEVLGHGDEWRGLTELPHLPVGLFKSHLLSSVPEDEVVRTMVSSGTTGQAVSRIVLDRDTAQRQTHALASIMGHILGPKRLPMLIVDSKAAISGKGALSARGAGVLGMMNFGRKHRFVLDDDMTVDETAVREFAEEHAGEPVLIFGFTFMIWEYLYRPLQASGIDLGGATVVHSGGWKKLIEQAVDNETYKRKLADAFGIERVYNFYGMVEQVGSVFLEGEDGHLYAPNFADVIVRDPLTWEEAPVGSEGVLQVVSALPSSYPGHSILTEDLGVVHGVDDSTVGRAGKHFSIIGRVPKAELRGCSDTHAYSRS